MAPLKDIFTVALLVLSGVDAKRKDKVSYSRYVTSDCNGHPLSGDINDLKLRSGISECKSIAAQGIRFQMHKKGKYNHWIDDVNSGFKKCGVTMYRGVGCIPGNIVGEVSLPAVFNECNSLHDNAGSIQFWCHPNNYQGIPQTPKVVEVPVVTSYPVTSYSIDKYGTAHPVVQTTVVTVVTVVPVVAGTKPPPFTGNPPPVNLTATETFTMGDPVDITGQITSATTNLPPIFTDSVDIPGHITSVLSDIVPIFTDPVDIDFEGPLPNFPPIWSLPTQLPYKVNARAESNPQAALEPREEEHNVKGVWMKHPWTQSNLCFKCWTKHEADFGNFKCRSGTKYPVSCPPMPGPVAPTVFEGITHTKTVEFWKTEIDLFSLAPQPSAEADKRSHHTDVVFQNPYLHDMQMCADAEWENKGHSDAEVRLQEVKSLGRCKDKDRMNIDVGIPRQTQTEHAYVTLSITHTTFPVWALPTTPITTTTIIKAPSPPPVTVITTVTQPSSLTTATMTVPGETVLTTYTLPVYPPPHLPPQ